MDPHDISADAVATMRRCARDGLGFNCTFVDDGMKVVVGLAQRAVLAGLAADFRTDMQERFTAAAEKHRERHEASLGFPPHRAKAHPMTIPLPSEKDIGHMLGKPKETLGESMVRLVARISDPEAFGDLAAQRDLTARQSAARAKAREIIAAMLDKIDALESELDSALDALIRRIKGESDLASAREWIGLNYPEKFKAAFPGEPSPKGRLPSKREPDA